jgi:Glycosyltransferases involved in cell wall biogenesis
MKVSVLIPAFHAGPFIATALESVRAQAHADWEIVVVEDGSHDDTERIVRDFAASVPQPVRYENLGQNFGVSIVRNRLLDLAEGDAVAFLDADDTWESSHLLHAVAAIALGADFVVAGVRTIDLASNTALQTISPPASLVRDPVLSLFRQSVIVTSSAVVLKRSLAQRVGHFDPHLRIGEDRDYWLRCALTGARFHGTRGYTCNYSKHPASSMARTILVAQHNARFYEKYRSLAAVPARLRRHLLADSLISLGRLLRAEDRRRSENCLWRALQCEPFNPRILAHLAVTRLHRRAAA